MSENISLTSKVNEVKLLLAGIETASLKERLDSYHINIKKNHPEKGGGKIISLPAETFGGSISCFTGSSCLYGCLHMGEINMKNYTLPIINLTLV